MTPIKRRTTVTTRVASISIGSAHPVVVQSMTNTPTADVRATVAQIAELAAAGSEMVRMTVNDSAAANAVPEIRERLAGQGVEVPLIGDFHFNGHHLLSKHSDCAQALAKYRINPGNVGGSRRDENFSTIIKVAVDNDRPVRIGVNWGSLDKRLLSELMDENARLRVPLGARDVMLNAMVESTVRSAELSEELGLPHDHIVLSAKMSQVGDLVDVYRMLASRTDYPLHVGLTEAGLGTRGIVYSAAGLSVLLYEGIGDTVRASLTPSPGHDRTEEVRVSQEIIQALGLRSFAPQVTACPGCGRTASSLFQALADDIQSYLRTQLPNWRETYPGVEEMRVAVMGCVVNGPGESKHADIGISLPGVSEDLKAPVYADGELLTTLEGDQIGDDFVELLNRYVGKRYGTTEV
jgi:(E)-4-hydroxy-3-methylbut-2-enyl-diphosphate synthase